MRRAVSVSLFLSLAFFIAAGARAQEFDPRYVLSPGDYLEISVWKDESLSRELIVPPDGVISFPLIGDIDARGLTVTSLREKISEKLSEYVPDVTVTVVLNQAVSLKAYVIGKVNNPGEFPINLETTVAQVLSMAGGLNAFASEDSILIIRRQGGETVKIPFDYGELKKGRNLQQNIVIQRGDVVVVP